MTTPAVAPRPAVPATPRAAPVGETREDVHAASHFDRQLHAARQRNVVKDADHSSGRAERREHLSTPRDNQTAAATPAADPQASPKPSPTASAAVVETADPVTKMAEAPAEKDEPDDQAASALAGAMLALLRPPVAGVLPPAAAVAAGTADATLLAGKTLATDAKAAALLSPGGVNGAAAAPVGALPAATSALIAADRGALPSVESGKDPSKDATQAVSLPAPSAPAAPAAAAHALQLTSPPGSQAFGQDLGQQVAWLGGQDIKQARIRLHPEELGSLDVSVSVTHGRVDVVFSAQHPAAVAAVQQSLPQLDHLLAQHGLSLGHAEVGQHDRGDRHDRAGGAGTGTLDDAGDNHGSNVPVSLRKVGLLDAFA